jgi:hypothetical protein
MNVDKFLYFIIELNTCSRPGGGLLILPPLEFSSNDIINAVGGSEI